MLSAFPTLQVFYINTPLLLTRYAIEDLYVGEWTTSTNIQRVYIYHGYDWDYHFQLEPHTRGAGLLIHKNNGEWKRIRIPCVTGPGCPQKSFIQAFLDADDDEFGPEEDLVNGLHCPVYRSDEDDKEEEGCDWYSEVDDEDEYGGDLDERDQVKVAEE